MTSARYVDATAAAGVPVTEMLTPAMARARIGSMCLRQARPDTTRSMARKNVSIRSSPLGRKRAARPGGPARGCAYNNPTVGGAVERENRAIVPIRLQDFRPGRDAQRRVIHCRWPGSSGTRFASARLLGDARCEPYERSTAGVAI